MLPNHLEQAMFAVRVGELKAGKVLPNDARLIGAVLRQALLDGSCREHAANFASRYAGHSVSTTLDRLVTRCLVRASDADKASFSPFEAQAGMNQPPLRVEFD